MPKGLLPFIPPSLRVVAVTAEPEHVMVLAVPRSTEPCCPACSSRSDSVHGTYKRHLADLPCQGRSVGLCMPAAPPALPQPRLPPPDLQRDPAGRRGTTRTPHATPS
jgi:hypothetical protein